MRAIGHKVLYDKLEKAGFVPSGCRIIDFHISVDSAVLLRYEKLLSPEETKQFGEALVDSIKKFESDEAFYNKAP